MPNKPKDKMVQDKIIIGAIQSKLNGSNQGSTGKASSQFTSNFNQTIEIKNSEGLDEFEEMKAKKSTGYQRN